MDPDFWRNRWATGQIGFHLGEVNPLLVAHHAVLPPGGRVLVPLCGKSLDLVWLAAEGHEVVGVELVEEAIEAFFRDESLRFAKVGDRYETAGLVILRADFFALTPADVGPVTAVWDRAALIAMPEAQRPAYAEQLRRLAPGATVLLVTLEHDAPSGPPFSVPEREVNARFGEDRVELLEEQDVFAQSPSIASKGATRVVERAYRIAL